MQDADNISRADSPISIDPAGPPTSHQKAAASDMLEGAPTIACDYVDVVRGEGDQPRFVLQPHFSGGAVASPAFTLEIEGARALARHLNALITDTY